MASPKSEPTGVPIWFVAWCLVVAAIWLTPAPLVERFVVGPLFDDIFRRVLAEQPLTEQHLASLHRAQVLAMRILACAGAGLYLVVRTLTTRWRHQESAS